jgi:hypothetical protein
VFGTGLIRLHASEARHAERYWAGCIIIDGGWRDARETERYDGKRTQTHANDAVHDGIPGLKPMHRQGLGWTAAKHLSPPHSHQSKYVHTTGKGVTENTENWRRAQGLAPLHPSLEEWAPVEEVLEPWCLWAACHPIPSQQVQQSPDGWLHQPLRPRFFVGFLSSPREGPCPHACASCLGLIYSLACFHGWLCHGGCSST